MAHVVLGGTHHPLRKSNSLDAAHKATRSGIDISSPQCELYFDRKKYM